MQKTRIEILKSKVVNVIDPKSKPGCYSRCELLIWLNNLLSSEFESVEELRTGAAYCQGIDMLFPGALPLKRVKFETNLEHEFIHNFKLLAAAFKKLDIKKSVPLTVLVKGGGKENFEFLQWFRKFFDANDEGRKYDALEARGGVAMGFKHKGPKRACVMTGAVPLSKTNRATRLDRTLTNSSFSVVHRSGTVISATLWSCEDEEGTPEITREDKSEDVGDCGPLKEGKETAKTYKNHAPHEAGGGAGVDFVHAESRAANRTNSETTEEDAYGAANQEDCLMLDFFQCKIKGVSKKNHEANREEALAIGTLDKTVELCRNEEEKHGFGRCLESEADGGLEMPAEVLNIDESNASSPIVSTTLYAHAQEDHGEEAPNDPNKTTAENPRLNDVGDDVSVLLRSSTFIIETSERVEIVGKNVQIEGHEPKIAADKSFFVKSDDDWTEPEYSGDEDENGSVHTINEDGNPAVVGDNGDYDAKDVPVNDKIEEVGDPAASGDAKPQDFYHNTQENGRADGDGL